MTQKSKKKPGTVYLIGAGPGDPELLTLKAKSLLEKADAVFYDYLVNPEVLTWAKTAELFYVGKIGHEATITQQQIQERLLDSAKKYTNIVRLKGGDPYLFGRGGEEAEFLTQHQVPFQVIPGISSAFAVPAYAGIPLTHREWSSSVTILTGHQEVAKEAGGLTHSEYLPPPHHGTLVYLMGVKTLAQKCVALIARGWSAETPAAIIQWGTYPLQKSQEGTLQTLAALAGEAGIEAPAVVVVGDVVKLRAKLNFHESKPLFGKKILVTRALPQALSLATMLKDLGAEPVLFPTLEVVSAAWSEELKSEFSRLGDYAWIVFTSANGVEEFFKKLRELSRDARALAGLKVASVGPATSLRLKDFGITPDLEAEDASGLVLAKQIAAQGASGRVLWVRPTDGNEDGIHVLENAGKQVVALTLYQKNTPRYSSDAIRSMLQSPPDLLTFTSASTVKNFYEIFEATPHLEEALKIPCAVMGRSAEAKARELAFDLRAEASEPSLSALLEAIVDYFSSFTSVESSSKKA